MTEQNLRELLDELKETILAGFIKEEDLENKAKRYSKYLPF